MMLNLPRGICSWQCHKLSFQSRHQLTFLGVPSSPFRQQVRMVEGHQCHRVAHAHRRMLLGKSFDATSPNGRFVEGAAGINGQPLHRIEVHGKNLFYFFGTCPPDTVVMHIHFGMSGAFKTMTLPGPDPTETTRLVLVHQPMNIVAHLSAMTVQHGPLSFYEEKITKLGPDPLREDADKELLWAKMTKSKKPVGLVLMDQSMIAGVGNIYRAEILFKAGIHPEQPSHTISREAFDLIWYHSVDLLQRGFTSGSILTVDPEEAKVLGKPWTRRYIYNQKTCGRCHGPVRTWDMATRTVYACEHCQPLVSGTVLPPDRQRAVSAAVNARLFKSHCAPDDSCEDVAPAKMTCQELRAHLLQLNLDTRGRKEVLIERLEKARQWLEDSRTPDVAGPSGAKDKDDEQEEIVLLTPPRTSKGPRGLAATPLTPLEDVGSPSEVVKTRSGRITSALPLRLFQEEEATTTDSEDIVDQADRMLAANLSGPMTAPPPTTATHWQTCTTAHLRSELKSKGLSTRGKKVDLIARLVEASCDGPPCPASTMPIPSTSKAHLEGADGGSGGTLTSETDQEVPALHGDIQMDLDIKPGTARLAGQMASAQAAAEEKEVAGENRAVEHVALPKEDLTNAVMGEDVEQSRQRTRRAIGSRTTARKKMKLTS